MCQWSTRFCLDLWSYFTTSGRICYERTAKDHLTDAQTSRPMVVLGPNRATTWKYVDHWSWITTSGREMDRWAGHTSDHLIVCRPWVVIHDHWSMCDPLTGHLFSSIRPLVVFGRVSRPVVVTVWALYDLWSLQDDQWSCGIAISTSGRKSRPVVLVISTSEGHCLSPTWLVGDQVHQCLSCRPTGGPEVWVYRRGCSQGV